MAAKNNVTNGDISGTINQDKITGLTIALNAKQATANMVKAPTNTDTGFSDADMTDQTKYPSMNAARQIADQIVSENIIAVDQEIEQLNTNYTNLSKTVENNKAAAEGAIDTANGKITKLETTVGSSTSGLVKDVADLKTNVGTTNVGTQIDNKINTLDSTVTQVANQIVKSVTQTDGKITPVYGKVAKADLDTALTTEIDGKMAKTAYDTATTMAADGTYAKKANTVAQNLTALDGQVKMNTGAIDTANGMITALETTVGNATSGLVKDVADLKTNVGSTNVGTQIDNKIKALDSTVAAVADGVVQSVTQTDGKITPVYGKVATNDIEDDAVSTAKIKSPTTTECADGKCALVDLGSGVQWLPIVNVYE